MFAGRWNLCSLALGTNLQQCKDWLGLYNIHITQYKKMKLVIFVNFPKWSTWAILKTREELYTFQLYRHPRKTVIMWVSWLSIQLIIPCWTSFISICISWRQIFSLKNDSNSGIWQSAILKSLYNKSSSNEGCLPSKFVFHRRLSSIKVRLLSKVVFHWISSSIEGRLPSKAVFHRRVSSIEVCLPSKVVFH